MKLWKKKLKRFHIANPLRKTKIWRYYGEEKKKKGKIMCHD